MAAFAFSTSDEARAAVGEGTLSGPFVHDNLAVYFIHGTSAPGAVPLTLEEALAKGAVRVFETGEVNELKIENTGSEAVFIQSGDIVKGGRQDRVVMSSFVLPSKSGEMSLAAFCVEHGRWSARGAEDPTTFASAAEAVPSREAKLAMSAPRAAMSALGGEDRGDGNDIYARQAQVWNSVSATQSKLSRSVHADVASPESATSLQLSLENDKLKELRNAYVSALQNAGMNGDDIVGYAFAINGKLNSTDVYASNGLFRKMWLKKLQSAATEAIGERNDEKGASPPEADAVTAFLDKAKQGIVKEKASLDNDNTIEVRDSAAAVYVAASPSAGAVFHESYVAK